MPAPAWDELQYLSEAMRHGSMSAAARSLGVDHATVSRRIRRLEQQLRQPVLDRQRAGLVLTPFGEAVLAEAERMGDAASTIARLAEARPRLAGLVRVTSTGMFATAYLTPALATLRKTQPLIDIELIVDERSLSLARREADIALRLARPKSSELVARRVATLGYGVYAASAYVRGLRKRPPVFVGFEEIISTSPRSAGFGRSPDRMPSRFVRTTGWLKSKPSVLG